MTDRTWMPTAAGILQIITGVAGLTGAGALTIALGIVLTVQRSEVHQPSDEFGLTLAASLLGALATCAGILGLLALAGGLSTLRRKSLAWALTGAIAATFCLMPLGIAALVLTVMGQGEFGGGSAATPQQPEASSS